MTPNTNTKQVDQYLIDGCGRCKLYKTPQCKVHTWSTELKVLRAIIQDCGLTEELKWSVPCYTFENKNVLILAAFKDYCSVSFFKGALLKDAKKLLSSPGENSQAARQFRFTSVKEIEKLSTNIKAYIKEAIELEKQGKKIEFKQTSEDLMIEELESAFKKNASLKKAFYALTPGRQRGYLLFFSQAKQSATRASRIEKCTAAILKGKGLND
ncbi:MAG: DUF1801 domain-containing protein [Bacteroidetes bacterium]|nr:DUF1801 domain-containing protein [Bacteroidota bacterium]